MERGGQRVPVGVAAFDVEDLALADALRARGGAHRVGGFQHAAAVSGPATR